MITIERLSPVGSNKHVWNFSVSDTHGAIIIRLMSYVHFQRALGKRKHIMTSQYGLLRGRGTPPPLRGDQVPWDLKPEADVRAKAAALIQVII